MQVLEKVGLFDNYKLIQTSLDRPEIIQIHRFMEYPNLIALTFSLFLLKRL